MTQKMKLKLFETMLNLEHLGEQNDNIPELRDKYFHESEGAYAMLTALGIEHEYIKWSYGK